MEVEATPSETPDEFLKNLEGSLKQDTTIDTALLSILAEHILKAEPAENAVEQAGKAIEKLATERANPPKADISNG